MDNIVQVRMYFYDYDVGKVSLVWGIDGWKAIPELYWPDNTILTDRGTLRTQMRKSDHMFVADLRIPADSQIRYGFIVAETQHKFGVAHWLPSSRLNSIAIYKNQPIHLIRLVLWTINQIVRRLRRNAWVDLFKRSADIQWQRTNHTRFIILAEARTGSTLLTTLLQSHPNTLMYGELFNPKYRTGLGFQNRKPAKVAIDYLNNHVYKTYKDQRVRAVGFKIFYRHNQPIWTYVWRYLRESGVHIVHLKRRDLLARYLSWELAKQSRQWLVSDDKAEHSEYDAPITLDPQSCIDDLNQMVHQQEYYEEFFVDNPMIEVFYEDLVDDTESECKRILEFLGLPEYDLNTRLRKQRTKTKQEVIANYSELRSAFEASVRSGEADPEWLRFFDD